MAPFSRANQLVSDIEEVVEASAATTLPGHPSILHDDPTSMQKLLDKEFWAHDLETMAPRLWIMTTYSSANINPLHRQKVKGREIIVTEEARLHLVWIHNRIFIKPLPPYILSHTFWEIYLNERRPLSDCQLRVRRAALGFLRTYRYLIQHESDFNIAQQDNLRLLPKDVDWTSFRRFVSELNCIEDSVVSMRYFYGELRLTRLNFYAPLLLRKFHFEQVHGQYGDFFARMYGPILFVFALVSTVLNSMQVALAVEQVVDAHWKIVWSLSRWFSMISLLGVAVISMWFILLWLWMFLDEWMYTIRRKIERRRETRKMLGW
jgi:hypothetical protein